MAKPTPAMGYGAPSRPYVFAEGLKGTDLLQQRAALLDGQRIDAGGDHHGPTDERAAEVVVEVADAVGPGFGGRAHGCCSRDLRDGLRSPMLAECVQRERATRRPPRW